MALTAAQRQIAECGARFRVGACGRRFGKTYLAVNEMARFATPVRQKIWYVAPTYRQAKQIVWEPLKERLAERRWLKGKPNEQELLARLVNDTTISLKGADKPDSLRGVGVNFLVIDEAADIKPDAWFKVLRPTLADTKGHALIIGTPKGRNWFHEIFKRGLGLMNDEWASFQFTTLDGGNVSDDEIEQARLDMDDVTFQQEFLASFLSFSGRAYYPFDERTHTAPLPYDPRAPLFIGLDFNVDPGVAAVAQDQRLPNGLDGLAVIGEVWIPRNSNTERVCDRLIHDWSAHEGRVIVYGDATGGARGSAKIAGSDWEIVMAKLRPVFKDRLSLEVPAANPPERARVNAMNTRLRSAAGEVRLMVDPARAPHVVRDLEGVVLLEGGSGEIDKKKTPELSHISDGLGYLVVKRHPVVSRVYGGATSEGGTVVNDDEDSPFFGTSAPSPWR